MCGLFAEIAGKGSYISAAETISRLDTLIHRGPDGWGTIYWSESGGLSQVDEDATIALGHRRLSIIDLSEGGVQPMTSSTGRFVITFNGEIYNYLELREELRAQGVVFKTESDTEVLLESWTRWGADCLNRLDGMFSFVILDVFARRLFAVRDFFGIKPLYYSHTHSCGMRFASEPVALLEGSPEGTSEILFRFLRWGALDDDTSTFFKGIWQLPPASMMTIDLAYGSMRIDRYWQAPAVRVDGCEASNEEFREIFLSAVDRHLRADVPVSATLSGGIDSSAICSAMRELRPNEPIVAFSYVADGPASEEKWIDIVGGEKRLIVKKIHIDESEAIDNLSKIVRAQGQPFGSGSVYAQYCIFQAIRDSGYKVMLDGQGADEILGGYKAFLPTYLRDLVLRGRVGAATKLLFSHIRRDPGSAVSVSLRSGRLFMPNILVSSMRALVGSNLNVSFLSSPWLSERGVRPQEDESVQVGYYSDLEAVLIAARESTILPALLRYADRNAMAFSVENRVPFLSRPLVEAAALAPTEALISSDARTKAVLRDSLVGILPDAIRNRHDKIGFRATEEVWMRMRPDWVHHACEHACTLPFIEPEGLRSSVDNFLAGDDREGQMLFRAFVLAEWAEAFNVKWL